MTNGVLRVCTRIAELLKMGFKVVFALMCLFCSVVFVAGRCTINFLQVAMLTAFCFWVWFGLQ